VYENIEYREKTRVAYTRVCIAKERMVAYQEERVTLLAKSLTIHRRNRGMDELESEIVQPR
jgi:ribosomal protein L35AE/L33A